MIIYKTLNSNISATTQYNDFVWGDEWGNIWGVGYSTEMSTIMTRAKPISSQILSHITTKRATDKKIAAITNTSNKIIDNVKKFILSMSVIMSAKNIKGYKLLAAGVNTVSINGKRLIKALLNSIETFCNFSFKEVTRITIITSATVNSLIRRNLFKTITMNTKLIVNISTKKHIKKLIAVIVDVLNLKNVKTFKSIEAIITAYETINKKINSTIKGITTTLALTSKGIKKSINVISNILSVEIYNLRFIKILSTAISVVASILAKFKPVVIDVTFKLGIPKNIIFNLDDITDLIYDSKLDKYTK